jgi:sugar lactone lactonase YvrE
MLSLGDVGFLGSRLSRPECVLATRAGDIFCSDRRGGISHLPPEGGHRLYTGASLDLSVPLLPNGFALDRDGSFLIAHLNDDKGGVFRLTRDGQLAPVLLALDGRDLPVTNFVLLDHDERIWVTLSTRQNPRVKAFRPDVADGAIVLFDRKGARVVADGLGFANEVRVSPDRRWLYANETYAKRLSRFPLGSDGTLGPKDVVHEFGPAQFPDGLAFDADGGVWVTCIVSNALVRVGRDGRATTILEDCDPRHAAAVESAFQNGVLDRVLLDKPAWSKLAHISSLAFAGDDLRTGLIGVLLDDKLATVRMPVAGHPMVHWNWR